MIEVVALTAAHLDALAADPGRLDRAWIERRAVERPEGPAVALLRAGVVLAAGGIAPLWPGVGQAWAIVSPVAARAHGRAVTRRAWALLPEMARELGLRRVQCVVHARHLRARAWAESFGFQAEGLLRRYGPDGADHWIYGLVEGGRF